MLIKEYYGYLIFFIKGALKKVFFVLKIFKYLDFLVIQKYRLIREKRLISKFMTSQSEKEPVALDISLNISRSKGIRTMKSGQLI